MSIEGAKISRDAAHRIQLLERKSLEVCGVTDVISFDEQLVVLNTLCGSMEVEGDSLRVHVLNLADGIVTLDGRVDSIRYYETSQNEKDGKNRFFNRLFR
jgi:sporulation protein YabP